MTAKNYRTSVREALVVLLTAAFQPPNDPYEPSQPDEPMMSGITIAYRPTRSPVNLPAVTFYDTRDRADDRVPLDRWSLHIDVWVRVDLDNAEQIAQRIIEVLDRQPFNVSDDSALVAYCVLTSDSDAPQFDADLVRKSLLFTMHVYDYNAPLPA